MLDFNLVSVSVGAASFAALTALMYFDKYRSNIGRWLLLASAVSTIWLGLQVAYYVHDLEGLVLTSLAVGEVLRDLSWLAVLVVLLSRMGDSERYRKLIAIVGALSAVALTANVIPLFDSTAIYSAALSKLTLASFLALAIAGLVLVEQLYRNTHPDRRWSIKYLCLGLGGLFAYDFMLYADGLLFNRVDPALWAGRGAANAIAMPLVAITAARNKDWRVNLFVSRQIVFHSSALLAIGLYLLAMAGAGYYLQFYGGEWGQALSVVFVFAAAILLLSLVSSSSLRSHLRLFLAKHFYRNKYDYGEVWLSFTHRLSQVGDEPNALRTTILRALTDIMDATSGVMWERGIAGHYSIAANWEMEPIRLQEIIGDEPLIAALAGDQVIDIRAEASRAIVDADSILPSWILELPRAWLLVPIIHDEELLAIVLLGEPRSSSPLSWEDLPLLRTLGRQAASYLALVRTTDALADARQFEAFNRLSAFLVHDLKNVIAQLSLVVRNSERHRNNPEFITDAFMTIGDAVAKMSRMLANLRHANTGPSEVVVLHDVINSAIKHVSSRTPIPSFNSPSDGLRVIGNRDSLGAVFEHLLQNAQDATERTGSIQISLRKLDARAVIEIVDNGCGMTQEFVQNRLFKPFDTTKGKAGMGIGVFESLHLVTNMGGRMVVESALGTGTTFRITLPLVEETESVPSGSENLERYA
jgi:putative PEP-CTERM system histidine kinase